MILVGAFLSIIREICVAYAARVPNAAVVIPRVNMKIIPKAVNVSLPVLWEGII